MPHQHFLHLPLLATHYDDMHYRNDKEIKLKNIQKQKKKNKNSETRLKIFDSITFFSSFPLFVSLSRSNPLSPLIDATINHEHLQARRRHDSSPQHSRSPPQNLRHQIMFRSQIPLHISPNSFAFHFATITHSLGVNFSFSGISRKTQELYAIVFLARYLDLFTDFISVYNTFMKVVFIASSLAIVWCMRVHPMVRRSYDKEVDTFRYYFLIAASFVLALVLHEKFTFQEVCFFL